jgi:hypothetical protein
MPPYRATWWKEVGKLVGGEGKEREDVVIRFVGRD